MIPYKLSKMNYRISRSAKSCRRKHRQRQIAAMGACLSGRQVFTNSKMGDEVFIF